MGTVHLNQGAQKYQCMASVHQHQTPNNVTYKIEVCGFVEEESLRDIHSFWMLVTPFQSTSFGMPIEILRPNCARAPGKHNQQVHRVFSLVACRQACCHQSRTHSNSIIGHLGNYGLICMRSRRQTSKALGRGRSRLGLLFFLFFFLWGPLSFSNPPGASILAWRNEKFKTQF